MVNVGCQAGDVRFRLFVFLALCSVIVGPFLHAAVYPPKVDEPKGNHARAIPVPAARILALYVYTGSSYSKVQWYMKISRTRKIRTSRYYRHISKKKSRQKDNKSFPYRCEGPIYHNGNDGDGYFPQSNEFGTQNGGGSNYDDNSFPYRRGDPRSHNGRDVDGNFPQSKEFGAQNGGGSGHDDNSFPYGGGGPISHNGRDCDGNFPQSKEFGTQNGGGSRYDDNSFPYRRGDPISHNSRDGDGNFPQSKEFGTQNGGGSGHDDESFPFGCGGPIYHNGKDGEANFKQSNEFVSQNGGGSRKEDETNVQSNLSADGNPLPCEAANLPKPNGLCPNCDQHHENEIQMPYECPLTLQDTQHPEYIDSLVEDASINDIDTIQLKDLTRITTLGEGAFGKVDLVHLNRDHNKTFALKHMAKAHLRKNHQEVHVFSERDILQESNSPFIVRLYKSFRDEKYLYLLMEVCLGGDLYNRLRFRGSCDEFTTRFCVACVLEAFEYLHNKGIIYRDLKPENLLLDSNGYVKLADFGLSKKIAPEEKTFTFCGSPDYMPPEVIVMFGHDHAADYWTVGILMFDLMYGRPPFTGESQSQIIENIQEGFDDYEFPDEIGHQARNLIRKLCIANPEERLGYEKGGISAIKNHRWFDGFDWTSLQNRTMVSPIMPLNKVRSPWDHSNFDVIPEDHYIPPDDFSGWDADF